MRKTACIAAVVIVGIAVPAIYLLVASGTGGDAPSQANGGVQAQDPDSQPRSADEAAPLQVIGDARQSRSSSPDAMYATEGLGALALPSGVPDPWRYDLISFGQFEREDELLASWPPYDPELVEGLPADLPVSELVGVGRRKLHEFWENGGIAREGACQCIYAARAALERACLAEPGNEVASILLLETMQAHVPEAYAFQLKSRDQSSFDDAFAEWRPKLKNIMGLNPYIEELRVRHFAEVISKKAPEDVEPWDVALVRDLLCARCFDMDDARMRGLVLAAAAKTPEDSEARAKFELKLLAVSQLSRDGRIGLADWAVGVCEKRGWTDLKRRFSESRATLKAGGETSGVSEESAWRVLSPEKADSPIFEPRKASFLGPSSRAERLVFKGDTEQKPVRLSDPRGFLSRVFEDL